MYFVERQGRRYLYETKRRSGKVIKTYRGCGWNAEALKTVVDDVNVQYRAWRAKKKAVRHEYFDEIRRRRIWMEQASTHWRAILLDAGFRRHYRGAWRRRRVVPMMEPPTTPTTVTEDQVPELARKADAGDDGAFALVRGYLASRPDAVREIGDMGRALVKARLAMLTQHSRVKAEAVSRWIRQTERGLDPQSPAERLLVAQVIVTYVESALADWMVHNHDLGKGPTFTAEEIQAGQDRARREHLLAVKRFEEVRLITAKQALIRARTVATGKATLSIARPVSTRSISRPRRRGGRDCQARQLA